MNMGFSKLFPVESFFDMSIFYLSRMTLDPNKTTFFLGVQKISQNRWEMLGLGAIML
jgi:hypothetical protein